MDLNRFSSETTAGTTGTSDRSAPYICIALFHVVERDTHLSDFGFYKSERYAFLRDKSERNDRNHTRELRQRIQAIAKIFPCDTKTMTIYDDIRYKRWRYA